MADIKPITNKYITKTDYINYFRYPSTFWFLLDDEISSVIAHEEQVDPTEDLKIDDYFKLLNEIVESSQHLVLENAIKLSKIKNQKLIAWLKDFFSIPNLSLYDHSAVKEDKTEEIIKILQDDSRPSAFFYKPSLISGKLKINPTAIFKYKKRIYLLDHFWSTTLKRADLAGFIFYDYFINNHTPIRIAQYLVSNLSAKPAPNKELIIEIGNSLPFKSQKRKPEGVQDERMKNINTLFGLEIEYQGSIYEKIFKEKDYDFINNEGWDMSEEWNLLQPEKVIRELTEFLDKPDREINFEKQANRFLYQKGKIVPPSTRHYKLVFQKEYPEFTYSSSLLALERTATILMSCKNQIQRDFFFDLVNNLRFIRELKQDQGYLVYYDAEKNFRKIRAARMKVYYDFESVSLPYPFFENTKPYTQIVLQISLIKTLDGEEKEVKNLIIDPLELTLDSFRRIIDLIYVDEPGVIYIVYNKSFENTRLKEMAALIDDEDYSFKVMSIIDRTVDLADWFSYNNTPHIIHKKLKGFHSIKKVNDMVPKHIEKKTKIQKYSELKKCQNGVMAQSLLLSRALVTNAEADNKNWKKNKEFMYKYCENDVRSMIAVELFIQELLENNKYPFGDQERYLAEKLSFKRKRSIDG